MIIFQQKTQDIKLQTKYRLLRTPIQTYQESFVLQVGLYQNNKKVMGFVHIDKNGKQLYSRILDQERKFPNLRLLNLHQIILFYYPIGSIEIINLKTYEIKRIQHKPAPLNNNQQISAFQSQVFVFPQTKLFCIADYGRHFGKQSSSVTFYRYPSPNTALVKSQKIGQPDYYTREELMQKQFFQDQDQNNYYFFFKGNNHSMVISMLAIFGKNKQYQLKFTIFQRQQRDTASEKWQSVRYQIPFFDHMCDEIQQLRINMAVQPFQQGYIFFSGLVTKEVQEFSIKQTFQKNNFYFIDLDQQIVKYADFGLTQQLEESQYTHRVKLIKNNLIFLAVQQPGNDHSIVKYGKFYPLKQVFKQKDKSMIIRQFYQEHVDYDINNFTAAECLSEPIIQVSKMYRGQKMGNGFTFDTFRLVDTRQYTLQFMLAINPDFDEDLLQDVINLIYYSQ